MAASNAPALEQSTLSGDEPPSLACVEGKASAGQPSTSPGTVDALRKVVSLPGQEPESVAERAGPDAGRLMPGAWLVGARQLANGSLMEPARRLSGARAEAGTTGKWRTPEVGGAAPDRSSQPSVASPAVSDVQIGVSPRLRGKRGSLHCSGLSVGGSDDKLPVRQAPGARRVGVQGRAEGAADALHGRAVDTVEARGGACQANPTVRALDGKCGQPSHLCAPGVVGGPSARPIPSEGRSSPVGVLDTSGAACPRGSVLPWTGSQSVGSDGAWPRA